MMCRECGCDDAHHEEHGGGHAHAHAHSHVGADGKMIWHVHETPEHSVPTGQNESAGTPEPASRVVPLGRAVLAENDLQAEANRTFFRTRGIRVFNLISSPGSGKTELLVKTLERLAAEGI